MSEFSDNLPLNNVKGEKAVTACLAPCDGGAEQLTTTTDTNDTNLAAHVLSPAVTWWSKWSWSFWSKSIFGK